MRCWEGDRGACSKTLGSRLPWDPQLHLRTRAEKKGKQGRDQMHTRIHTTLFPGARKRKPPRTHGQMNG